MGADEGGFIPNLAVFFGFMLAVGGVGVLIFFIHHLASSVQASSIIASAADETVVSLGLENPPAPETTSALQAAFSISRHRTVDQDAAFGIRQLVDIALKALSPGINDTTTAVTCVEYLTTILARAATCDTPPSHRYEDGRLRVIAIGPTFAGLVADSFPGLGYGTSTAESPTANTYSALIIRSFC